jgi:cytidylate kinase
LQDGSGNDNRALAATQADLAKRDAADSRRAASPLTQAPDATVLDSSELSVDELVGEVMALIDAAERT